MISGFSNDFKLDSDDYYLQDQWDPAPVMEIVVTIVCVVGIAIVLALCCKCCCSNKYKGRVLQLPTAAVPAHMNVTVNPTGNVPYPTASPMPYGGGAAYPGAGGVMYPAAAPYPALAPYPTSSPYPPAPGAHGGPGPAGGVQYPAAPSAPHEQALPPTYEQVMSTEGAKHPYNPYAPH